ncbi:response regulator transcription factor [Pelosinus propionicus]|uniref:DNA-binding response regulator, OmpR family, contains REC and winged-helix (WHTH) domain n=1 Tax=Pelosinus propionicus DSM 13327 TaxID=1123291 RepID=A0A1I4IGJ7_9FIRM|nr:response regulator transcription factor [Pelosinus propionicus]SFL53438.1 DNA-binding response regulator, OmpR family, contains REC and winged-helix (wHTH) domain [Pelosinus propionicus DSM 13327]
MKLLLVEDEQRLVEALSYLLKKNGYATDIAMDGESGVEMALTGIYDVIILDRMLPKLDGISLLQEFRHRGFDTPVLFLTARDALKDRIEGLDAGADDYLVKPFSSEELLARLRALARRKTKELINQTITASGMNFDPLRGEVTKGQEIIQLSVKESLLLELLMYNQGQVITKERIFEKIWGYYSGTDIANVDLYIHYLRKKLSTSAIKTVRGVGYLFEEN